jgi:2-oxoglutarate dehydrogenase E1 component
MFQDRNSFLTGSNAVYLSELYARFIENPDALDQSWISFFESMHDDQKIILEENKANSLGISATKIIGVTLEENPVKSDKKQISGGISPEEAKRATLDSLRVLMLIRSYRVRGHLNAQLDPLGIQKKQELFPELDYHTYGFTEADLDREIFIDNVLGLDTAKLGTIVRRLQDTYCQSVGIEFMHIQVPEQKDWMQRQIEQNLNKTSHSVEDKKKILQHLTAAEGLEKFLQVKYTGTKRFGLEGAESTIAALEEILKQSSALGVKEVLLGMAHRGRLNVLTNFMKKPFAALFSEFQGNSAKPDDVQGSGDVKYHLGTSADRDCNGNLVHLSLTANPSHLEIANPVVLGKIRAKQTQREDTERSQVLGILIHGDAAFAGQGVVMECFAMSQLNGYTTGGTIHLVINNQIGFTTSPNYSRSGPYCTDVAKSIQAPIFHVNGDDPEAVVHVARLATEFRQKFKTDVVIDLVCYRRHGHNESDEPAFTQPVMYQKIAALPTTRKLYADKLVRESVLSVEEPDLMVSQFQQKLEEEFAAAHSYKVNKADWLEGKWAGLGILSEEEEMRDDNTDVPLSLLQEVGEAISRVPQTIDVNKKIVRQLEAKRQMIETGSGFDWATAEALAFGTLLVEGTPVRLSGQDCGRGTFSQRHSVLIDQQTEQRYVPLNTIKEGQKTYEVIDSLLSEEGVLGFEYGYSLAEPDGLTLWEGQFGDFANGAQVIFDQFISSGESKWLRMSGLTVLLPHGLEGQGPEHSSGRIERFLQSCAEDNWQVCNLTTPANYFHALRRQVRRNYRKPLIIMSPKSLLRHKLAVSSLAEMGPGSRFRRVIGETSSLVADDKVKRLILCTGKVYYDLVEERQKLGINDIAIVRIEQLYPWPKETIACQVARYKNAEIIWCQEEHANQGCWVFVDRRIQYIMDDLGLSHQNLYYVGRKAAAAPATGSHKNHVLEQSLLLEQALLHKAEDLQQPFSRVPLTKKHTSKRG